MATVQCQRGRNPILTYEVEDESGGSSQGFWVLNGAVLPNGQITTLTATRLSQLSFVAGCGQHDGVGYPRSGGFGYRKPRRLHHLYRHGGSPRADDSADSHGGERAAGPEPGARDQAFFQGSRSAGNTITSYEVEDTTTDSGHWVFNGVVEPTNQVIDVTVTQLAQRASTPAMAAILEGAGQ